MALTRTYQPITALPFGIYEVDTAANWTASDPTLPAGKMGVESDTGLFKIGDGSTAWTLLAYYSNPPVIVLSLAAYLALSPAAQMNGTWYVIPK